MLIKTPKLIVKSAKFDIISLMKIIFCALFFIVSSLSHADTTTGLVGWWKLDEGSGNSALDSSGKGNTGDLTGHAPTWTSNCKRNSCLSFNGSSEFVTVPNVSALVTNSNMSLTAWVKTSSSGGNSLGGICGIRNAESDTAFYIFQLNATTIEVRFRDSAGNTYTTSFAITADIWVHVALIYDGSNIYAYKNGTLAVSTAASGVFTRTDIPFEIGKSSPDVTWWYDGQVDDIRLYNRALTTSDLYMLYQNQHKIVNAAINTFQVK